MRRLELLASLRRGMTVSGLLPRPASHATRRFKIERGGGYAVPQLEDEIRARVRTTYVGDGIVLARVLGGLKMYLRGDDVGFAGHLMVEGYWESWLTSFFIRLLQPGMVAVDVGANFGYYTLLFGQICGPTGKVVAVEPNPAALECLRKTVAINGFDGRTLIEPIAAGEETGGVATLSLPSGEPKNAQLISTGTDVQSGHSVEVPVRSLDTLLADHERLDVVKIDAEGAEEAIVKGALATLRRHRPHLVLEYNATRYTEPRALLEELMGIYGRMARLDTGGRARTITVPDAAEDRSGEDQLLYFRRS